MSSSEQTSFQWSQNICPQFLLYAQGPYSDLCDQRKQGVASPNWWAVGLRSRDFRLLQLLKTDKFNLHEAGPQIQLHILGLGLACTGVGNLRRPILQFGKKNISAYRGQKRCPPSNNLIESLFQCFEVNHADQLLENVEIHLVFWGSKWSHGYSKCFIFSLVKVVVIIYLIK